MPMGQFFFELAAGSLLKFKAKSGFQVGVRVVVPPFPFGGEIKSKAVDNGDTVILFRKPSFEGVHIEEVKLINDEWVVAGAYGVVLVIVGTGSTMKQARDQVYNRISNILIPNMYYRDDIGERWFEDSDKLHNWGYLRDM